MSIYFSRQENRSVLLRNLSRSISEKTSRDESSGKISGNQKNFKNLLNHPLENESFLTNIVRKRQDGAHFS